MTRAGAEFGRPEIEDFLYGEAELLDQGNYRLWLDLFTEDGIYWVPMSPAQAEPLDHLSLFYEDRALLAMRVGRLLDSHAHALERPIRTSRTVGNVRIETSHAGLIVAASRFHLLEWQNERRRAFAGQYRHALAIQDGALRIRQKRVDLIDAEGAFETIQLIF